MARDQLALSLNLGIFRTGHVLKQVVGAKSAGKPQSQTLFLQPITARADNQMNQRRRPGKRARSPLVLVLVLAAKKVPRKFQANDTENVHL